jgi:DNA-binding MarR family transcriptional regulator
LALRAQQRIVNEFEKEGLVEFRPNPHHRRANLVVLTARGREIYEQADRLQPPWVNALSEGIVAEAFASGSKNRASWSRKKMINDDLYSRLPPRKRRAGQQARGQLSALSTYEARLAYRQQLAHFPRCGQYVGLNTLKVHSDL